MLTNCFENGAFKNCEHLLLLLKILHDDSQRIMLTNGSTWFPIPVQTGLKQLSSPSSLQYSTLPPTNLACWSGILLQEEWETVQPLVTSLPEARSSQHQLLIYNILALHANIKWLTNIKWSKLWPDTAFITGSSNVQFCISCVFFVCLLNHWVFFK